MSRIVIYPYKMRSNSAKALQKELQSRGHRVIRVRKNGRFRPNPDSDLIINWGNSAWPVSWHHQGGVYFNHPQYVGLATNKLHTFMALGGIPIPEFTTDWATAEEWFEEGNIVVEREVLVGHSGEGIILHDPGEGGVFDAHNGPSLYVKYIKKSAEYRVHVFNGNVIDIQQKKKKRGEDNINYRIRSHNRGWVFCRENITFPEEIKQLAIDSVRRLHLDFGAVDIVYNRHSNNSYVLEINSAPGLAGASIGIYADAIEKIER